MKNYTVYSEPGIYAGWPANHGAWQWGDEFLVGFLQGRYGKKSMHNILEPFELAQARSLDGGRTWHRESVSIPVDDIGVITTSYDIANSIIRARGTYDHGGDFIDPMGSFYASEDKGLTWHGPHGFDGLESVFQEPSINTSRTARLGDLLFMSVADGRMWGTDEVFCARHAGGRFELVGAVSADNARAVMPSVARLDSGMIVAVCRRRRTDRYGGWIEAFASRDDGKSWASIGEVGETGRSNGNPPALIKLHDGRLLCCFANRTDQMIVGAVFESDKWRQFVVRDGGNEDIGYPQLFMRMDGTPVCVYYWSDDKTPEQHIAATEVDCG